jgi:hypothetical protein
VQIIRHDDPLIAAAQRPWVTVLQVDLARVAALSGKRTQRRDIAVDGGNAKPHMEQQARVTSAASREVEHVPAAADQRRKSPHPQ